MRNKLSREERKKTEQFVQDMEQMMDNEGKEVILTQDADQRENLRVVALLSQMRFVPDERFEARLRARLFSQIYQLEQKEEHTMSLSTFLRPVWRPLLTAGLAALLVLGGWLAVSPDARAAAQDLIARFVEVESPWALIPAAPKPPEVEVSAPAVDGERPEVPAAAGAPEDLTEGALSSGAELPGVDELPVPGDIDAQMMTFEEAQAEFSFTLRMPQTLPDGYSFVGVLSAPEMPNLPEGPEGPSDLPRMKMPERATLVFAGPDGERLTLSESYVGDVPAVDVSLPVGQDSVQSVTVNGQSAQYVEGMWTPEGWKAEGHHLLHWQDTDDVVYELISPSLGLDTLLSIAESIR